MNWLVWALWAVAAAVSLAVFVALVKGGRPVRTLVASGLQGVCALLAVDVAGIFTGVSMGLNLFTALCCLVLGAPGMVMLLVMNTIFHIG